VIARDFGGLSAIRNRLVRPHWFPSADPLAGARKARSKFYRLLILAVAPLLATLSTVSDAASSNSLAKWFNSGRCAAFDRPYVFDSASMRQLPYLKPGYDDLIVTIPEGMQKALPVPWYVYDRKDGIAYKHVGQDSGIQDTVRFAGKPPVGVPQTSLGASHTKSGLRLGASSAAVVAALGAPYIIRACGLERYVYLRDRGGPPDELDFTIRKGRVVEIFSTLDG
jgi:hypothetical protein